MNLKAKYILASLINIMSQIGNTLVSDLRVFLIFEL